MKKVIFWDFDGTLVHFTSWRLAVLDALDDLEPGHNVEHDDIRPFLRNGFPWHRSDEPHTHLNNPDDWWRALEPLFLGCYKGVGYSDKRSQELAALVRKHMTKPGRFPLYYDAVTTLRELKNKGWTNIILSNHIPELAQVIDEMEIALYIDDCLSSANTGYEKPNIRAFHIALEKADNPDSVWMVGDNIESDVRGAERAGIPAILVHNPSDSEVKYYAENLSDIIDIVEQNSG